MGIVVKRSALQELSFRFDQKLPARTDARWRLGREREVELFEQDFLIGLWMGVAAQDQGATVGRREVHIEHLNGGQFVQNRTWGQSGCERKQTGSQGHVQAVSHKGHKDVRLNPMLALVIDGAQHQVVLEVLKGRFDFDQPDVELP